LGASIWLNGKATSSQFYRQVGRHEMMHLAGAEHVGKDDSMDGDNPPAMATCILESDFNSTTQLSQDDAAYLTWLHSSRDNRQLHANFGFEQSSRYWGVTNGTLSMASSGGSTGPGYAKFKAAGSVANSYIFQTIRIWTGDDDESYRSVLNAKAAGPTGNYTTRAQTALYRRTLSGGSTSTNCSYADDVKNPNDDSVSGSYVLVSQERVDAINNSWTGLVSNWVNLPTEDGFQFQVRAYGDSYSAAGPQPIYFDNVRGEGT
jgi:hypothetical protein